VNIYKYNRAAHRLLGLGTAIPGHSMTFLKRHQWLARVSVPVLMLRNCYSRVTRMLPL